MEKLVILNYENLTVHSYNMEEGVEVNEELISSLGFSPSNCHWMSGAVDTFFHKGTILANETPTRH